MPVQMPALHLQQQQQHHHRHLRSVTRQFCATTNNSRAENSLVHMGLLRPSTALLHGMG
jgi:hypothetical protein